MINHEIGTCRAIDKFDSNSQIAHVIPRFRRERRGRDEHAFGGVAPCQGTSELLDFRAADRILPTFRLNIDRI
jgi:hypothetical protein